MFAYLGENIEPYRQFSFLREFVNAEHSYFLILQGTALLVNGRLKALRGRNFSAAEKKLRKALRIFTIARAPMRIANCLSSLALLHLPGRSLRRCLRPVRQKGSVMPIPRSLCRSSCFRSWLRTDFRARPRLSSARRALCSSFCTSSGPAF